MYIIHLLNYYSNTKKEALFCFLISESFEDCLRTTISIGGDCDTTAAISCAVAEAFYGIPTEIIDEAGKYIPNDIKTLLTACYREQQVKKLRD